MAADSSKKDIPSSDGTLIVTEAATWNGTPYQLNGPASAKAVGGDCSGTTQKIYQAAGCLYEYQPARGFAEYAVKSGLFRELNADEKQDGDILSWSNHMAIYCSFMTNPAYATTERTNKGGTKWIQKNDMWTASHEGGQPYGPAELRWWRSDAPRRFRYQK